MLIDGGNVYIITTVQKSKEAEHLVLENFASLSHNWDMQKSFMMLQDQCKLMHKLGTQPDLRTSLSSILLPS